MNIIFRNSIILICVILLHAKAFSQNIYFINQSKRSVYVTKRTLLEEASFPYELEKTDKKVQEIPLGSLDAVYKVMMADAKDAWGSRDGYNYVLKPNDTIVITNKNELIHLAHIRSLKRTAELAMGEEIVERVAVKPVYKLEVLKYLTLQSKKNSIIERDKIIDSLSLPIIKYIKEYSIIRNIDPQVSQLYLYNYIGMRYYFKLSYNQKDLVYKNSVDKFYRDSLLNWSKEFNCSTCTNVPTYNNAAKKISDLLYNTLKPVERLAAISENSTGKTRHFLMSAFVNDRIEYNGADLSQLLSNYNKLCTDEVLKKMVNDNYLLASGGKAIGKGSTMLMTHDKKQISFEKLLNKNTGKILYLDFWASWCHPCIEEFPSSIKLKNSLASNSDVKLIYISIDRDFGSWVKMEKAQQLSSYDSFIIVNAGKDELSKTLDLDAIPRYVIVSKDGKFINLNASRPSEPKSFEILKKLSGE